VISQVNNDKQVERVKRSVEEACVPVPVAPHTERNILQCNEADRNSRAPVVDAKLELAEDLRGQGAFDEALELYYATVELHTKVGGQDCLEVASNKGNIGLVYENIRKKSEAKSLLRQQRFAAQNLALTIPSRTRNSLRGLLPSRKRIQIEGISPSHTIALLIKNICVVNYL